MRFESRELKPYGEFVEATDLVEGKIYFRVSFFEQEMLTPELVPLVFIGRNLQPDEPGLYFQDVASYMAGERYNPNDWIPLTEGERSKEHDHDYDCRFDVIEDKEITSVYEYEKALDSLLRCSIDRKKVTPNVDHFHAIFDGGREEENVLQ